MIYLDHAATSWPKPPEVLDAMADFLERAGGNPGRSGHRLSVAAGRIIYSAREVVAELFNASDPLRVIFASNATHAINIALRGLLRPGDRVVTSGMEHNAIMRPLRAMEQGQAWSDPGRGIDLVVIPCRTDGSLDPVAAERAITPGTRLVAITHASNVTGTLLRAAEVIALAHRVGALALLDAAQTAGVVPIDMQALGVDLLAFTGHKGLQGPPGTGGLILGADVDAHKIDPLMRGGTGSRSEFEMQPEDLPDKFESGTANGASIAGLAAGVRLALARGVDAIRAHEVALGRALVEGLAGVPGVQLYGPLDPALRTATVSFTMAERRVSDIALRLDDEYGVLCRVGLHCAPAAHRTIGTFPQGTVRFAAGPPTTLDEVRQAIEAVARIAVV